jgi:hypothetical protein
MASFPWRRTASRKVLGRGISSQLPSYPISVTVKSSVTASSKGYELLVREIYQQMLEQDEARNAPRSQNRHRPQSLGLYSAIPEAIPEVANS